MMHDLMDVAFALVKDAPGQSTPEDRQEIKVKLARRFPKRSPREVAAYRQARALVNACHDIGDACRAELLTRASRGEIGARVPRFQRRRLFRRRELRDVH